jgi:hypothetical protein
VWWGPIITTATKYGFLYESLLINYLIKIFLDPPSTSLMTTFITLIKLQKYERTSASNLPYLPQITHKVR